MDRRQSSTVTVASAALSDLILPVHESAAGSGSASGRPWRYENVIGMTAAVVRDLDPRAVPVKYAGRAPIAAVTVIAHHRIAVDVMFELSGGEASARFLCETKTVTTASGGLANPERSWAEFLAATTSEVLAAAAIPVRMRCLGASD